MSAREAILVIKLGALGDMIQALPAFERIRAAHPGGRLTLLTTPPYEALGRAMPWFDRIETDGRPRTLGAFLRLAARVRRARYARVYDLQGVDRTSLLFQALRPFPPAWSGVAAGCALPARDPRRLQRHTLERQAWQLREAGIWPDAPVEDGAAPAPRVDWLIGADRPTRCEPPLALIAPGASVRRPLKLWPAQRYGELAAALIASGFDVAVIGAEAERPLADIIRRAAPGARDLAGATDLATLARLGAAAAVAIGNDTGPMHLVAAAGAPSLVLFSADSDPALCGPRGDVNILRRPSLDSLSSAEVIGAAVRLAANCGAKPP
ncbi:MAG TPA: glycosyltransferase family 9 protein [Caulobacteraceae bacterium]|jgi:ADP-heptose:LPS heptosyltransferase|nr:glycosyltransferase family 9 protein [Caulobacteraceae bacterium]